MPTELAVRDAILTISDAWGLGHDAFQDRTQRLIRTCAKAWRDYGDGDVRRAAQMLAEQDRPARYSLPALVSGLCQGRALRRQGHREQQAEQDAANEDERARLYGDADYIARILRTYTMVGASRWGPPDKAAEYLAGKYGHDRALLMEAVRQGREDARQGKGAWLRGSL